MTVRGVAVRVGSRVAFWIAYVVTGWAERLAVLADDLGRTPEELAERAVEAALRPEVEVGDRVRIVCATMDDEDGSVVGEVALTIHGPGEGISIGVRPDVEILPTPPGFVHVIPSCPLCSWEVVE